MGPAHSAADKKKKTKHRLMLNKQAVKSVFSINFTF